eukprot:TRINITY_DN566_c1_g1_i1.p3 TRINITY_DN566_c1_g1~~TRINITY_DN566_c1_g1_i1.p3  ORF type:complete len:141 (-),score=33.41 TRINITY_DN566_c1_g1_i1:113-535(-)
MSFVGGKLNLKGGDAGLKSMGGVKKKKKKSKKKLEKLSQQVSEELKNSEDGVSKDTNLSQEQKLEEEEYNVGIIQDSEQQEEIEDKRTDYEKRRDEWMLRREQKLIQEAAKQSHRERVQDFNEKLAQLTEHYDIPKVGPG